MKNRKIIIAGAALLLFFILLPNIVYIIKFRNLPFSENPSDWQSFATYFTGMVNPIAAIFGTLILGFLTLQVAKQGADENKGLFLLEQKILAYQNLASLLEKFEQRYESSKGFNIIHGALNDVMTQEEAVREYVQTTEKLIASIVEIRAVVNNFPIAYGHLFRYNFKSKEFEDLKNILSNYLHDIRTPLYETGSNKTKKDFDGLRQRKVPDDTNLEDPVLNFLAKLKQEI